MLLKDAVTKIRFLGVLSFLRCSRGRGHQQGETPADLFGGAGGAGQRVCLCGISGFYWDKKRVSLAFGSWDLSSKHLALHNPF